MVLVEACLTRIYNTDCYKKYSSVIQWKIRVKKETEKKKKKKKKKKLRKTKVCIDIWL